MFPEDKRLILAAELSEGRNGMPFLSVVTSGDVPALTNRRKQGVAS